MKAFLAGIVALALLGGATGIVYDWAAVDSATGFRSAPNVHVQED